MASIQLSLPGNLSESAQQALLSGYFVGLPDYMPWVSQARLEEGQLIVDKEEPDSALLCVPWFLPPTTRELPSPLLNSGFPLLLSTATLIERGRPYDLAIELARGKVNQLRNQAADWESGGLEMTDELNEAILTASRTFAKAVCQARTNNAEREAEDALALALATSEDLVAAYVSQVMAARTGRTPRLPTSLGCNVSAPLAESADIASTFNALRVPFDWAQIEAEEGSYNWDSIDAWLEWAKPLKLALEAGPLFDMSPRRLPAWLPQKLGDPQDVANLMVDFLEAALERYRDQFRSWLITSGLNDPRLLELDEEEAIWLNTQLYAAAQQIHPTGEFHLALTQPWGEGVATGAPAYSPFVFADALLRGRVMLAALDLELVFGVQPRGSMTRDSLDVSRLFDLYALLGVPLRVTLGFPAAATADSQADPSLTLNSNWPAESWNEETQAGWVDTLARIAICKPFITGLTLTNYCDSQPHLFPNTGLVDAHGKPRPVLAKLRALREQYLE